MASLSETCNKNQGKFLVRTFQIMIKNSIFDQKMSKAVRLLQNMVRVFAEQKPDKWLASKKELEMACFIDRAESQGGLKEFAKLGWSV